MTGSKMDLNLLQQAADRCPVSFTNLPSRPLDVATISDIDGFISSQLLHRYLRHGFAVLQINAQEITREIIIQLADVLKLGNIFVPPLYQTGDYTSTEISEISAKQEHETAHPSFLGTVALDFHSDGTLQKIGYVKTTIMLCKAASAEGGETTLFNTSGAFANMLKTDPAAAIALATPGVLERKATLNGCTDVNCGPAFSIENGFLVTAYSMTHTDSIKPIKGVDIQALNRGEEFLKTASKPDSPYYARFKLLPGQLILLANTSISHGRTSYYDNQNDKRCMYRALFLKRPKIKREFAYLMENISSDIIEEQADNFFNNYRGVHES